MPTQNVYNKLQQCRAELQRINVKKSGKNKFSGFSYFELGDFLPHINDLFDKHGLCSNFSIVTQQDGETKRQEAVLIIYNSEKPDEQIVFTSPVASAELKGNTAIQALGAVHTYMKRYLYLNALEIVESDVLDEMSGSDKIEPEEYKCAVCDKKVAATKAKKTIEAFGKVYCSPECAEADGQTKN